MPYNCEAHSLTGFVQQLAVAYVAKGYRFYVTGRVPERKDPVAVDRKLVERYGVELSQWARARRKRAGQAAVQYLRHDRFFVLIATHGRHPIFEEEADIRDIRKAPLKYGGYAVSFRHSTVTGRSHASVRIEREEYLRLKSYFLELARHRTVPHLVEVFRSLPYEPYAPIRRQLLPILRAVNRERIASRFELVPRSCLRLRRRHVRVFVSGEPQMESLLSMENAA
jgi:hypothetical protein